MAPTCNTMTLKNEKTEEKLKFPSKYKVIIYNDNITPMGLVCAILEEIFKFDSKSAFDLMMKVHETGSGLAGIYIKSIAEMKKEQSLKVSQGAGYNLKVEIEKE